MKYIFRCQVWKDGVFIQNREGHVTDVEVTLLTQRSGELGFYKLLDTWNKMGDVGPFTYKYTSVVK